MEPFLNHFFAHLQCHTTADYGRLFGYARDSLREALPHADAAQVARLREAGILAAVDRASAWIDRLIRGEFVPIDLGDALEVGLPLVPADMDSPAAAVTLACLELVEAAYGSNEVLTQGGGVEEFDPQRHANMVSYYAARCNPSLARTLRRSQLDRARALWPDGELARPDPAVLDALDAETSA
jgi:hypothetical protein